MPITSRSARSTPGLRPAAPGPGAERRGRLALVLVAIGVGLQLVVGRLGPSVAVPPISPDLDQVPLANGWVVTGLLALALTLGGLGVGVGLSALRAGWRPDPGRLIAGAALAVLALLVGPPLGTADLGGYAAYGRMAAIDRDPYATTPRDLDGDPVADAAEAPWRDIRSIYGPLAAAEFRLAAEIGGDDREVVLRLLQVAAGGVFLGTGLLLDRRAARTGPEARRRAALLWSLNPLLLHQLVAGAHLDGSLTLLVVAAVLVWHPGLTGRGGVARSAGSGALLGLAGLLKATAAAPAAGLAVANLLVARHQGGRDGRWAGPAAFVGAGLVVTGLGYAAVGGAAALEPTREASRFVSRGTPWRFVASGLEQMLPQETARTLVGLLAAVVAVLLARAIFRALPGVDLPVRAALAASTAWLVVAPYSLPWYDALAWGLVALAAVGPAVVRLEGLLLLHTAFLSVAYLPGRVVGLTPGIETAQDVVRGILAPVVVLAVAVALFRLDRRHAPREALMVDGADGRRR